LFFSQNPVVVARCKQTSQQVKMQMEKFMTPAVRVKVVSAMLLAVACLRCTGQSAKTAANERDTAFALEQQGNTTEAETAWRDIVKSHPADAEAYAHLGFLEARQEHYKQAVPLYRKALALNPTMLGLSLNLGLALFKSGALKEAIQTFNPLLKDEPASSPEAQRLTALLGIAHYGLGQYAPAIPYLKTAATNEPQNLQFRLLLAHSCLSAKQFQCVLDTYHEILTLNAESAEADMLAGEALDEMHNTTGAIEQFRAAVKADPKEPNVHFGLGYLLWTQNQFEEAAHEFQAELANVPDNAQALAFLANADMQTNHSAEAFPLIHKALQIDPSLARAHLDLGVLYADGGRTEDAIRELKEAARLNPADPNPHWRLARLYQAMGKKDEAKVEFQKTKTLHQEENDTIFSKLKAAQEKGKPTDDNLNPPAHN
jgi:tetratricopeptide (TPR) repeat protein